MQDRSNPKKPLQPAPVAFEWIARPDRHGDNGVLAINGVPYLLKPVREDRAVNRRRPVVGYKLTKAGG
jgi:hypothetical protein